MEGDTITMSQQELDRLEIIQKVDDKHLKQPEAAERLGCTTRQVKRLLKSYREKGAKSLVSKKRGKTGNRKHSLEFKAKIMALVHQYYSDFGPTLAAEKLLERHGLKINKETLRQWMVEEQLWTGKHRKKLTTHQQRTRRSCFGELVQIDGSPHDWFEGRAETCCLLVFIDDATSRLLHLRFEPTETTLGYFRATRAYIKQYGRPLTFYGDKSGIFRVNHPETVEGEHETQFGRVARELDIVIICANSPQAKGRVERANLTLQDRLVKELRLRGISDIETANRFLPEFRKDINRRFGVEATAPTDAHRKSCPSEEIMDLLFTFQETRKLSKNLELSYKNLIYQIKTPGQGYGMRGSNVTVCDDKEGNITLLYKNKILEYTTYKKKKHITKITSSKEINHFVDEAVSASGNSTGHKPPKKHPWRQYQIVADKKKSEAA